MIRKSVWLLSAGLAALATPAFAQDAQPSTETGKPTTAPPTQGSTSQAAAVQNKAQEQQSVDTGDIVITATRRNEALSDVPMAVSAVTARDSAQHRRDRHPPAEPACPVAARLLDRLGSRRGSRPHPRHRHGRRQSRPRKLGRRLHRRRLSLAHRRRPQRTRPARPDRGAARPAGHAVRPQHVGRPHLDHHRQAALQPEVSGQVDVGNYNSAPARGEHHRAAHRHDRGPPRRRLREARRLPQGRRSRAAESTIAIAGCCAANCCSSRATIFRSG